MRGPRRAARLAAWLTVASLVLAGCEHGSPGVVDLPGDVGPSSDTLPRRLTFYDGDDRAPSVAGNVLVFARQGDAYANRGYAPTGREQCIAFLPLEGGTLQQVLCPHDLIVPPDTFVHTWFEPALSPDGSRIAFMWQRGPNVGPLGYYDAVLTVAPVDRPSDTTRTRVLVNYAEAGTYPRRADLATRISWVDASHLRFLATVERIFKVKGGGAERVTDTLYEPLAVMEVDVGTGATRVVPGADSALAYAPAPDGGIWLVRASDSAAVLHLDPATGARSLVGRFSSAALDLIAVDGAPVAIVSPLLDPAAPTNFPVPLVRGGAAVERLDPSSGLLLRMTGFTGPVVRLAAAGGRRFVAEVERANVPFGVPSDLWLLEVP